MEEKDEIKEYAMLDVRVTTSFGAIPVSRAVVTVCYNGPPGSSCKESVTDVTDCEGKTRRFFMYTRRARIGNRYVNLPRYAKCDVSVTADGYVPLRVREIPIFPGITVIRSFDLIEMKNSEAQ